MENLVWIDCEMTGLNPEADALIEVAVLITDGDLNVLGDGIDVIIKPPTRALRQMSEFVTHMHSSSGLLDALDHGTTLAKAQDQIMSYLREFVPEPGRAPLAGNSVSLDRVFLARNMPQVESHLHYRIIDVSSIKELVRRWYPRVFFAAPDKRGGHRALGDIQDSINELRYYREAVFMASPGLPKEAAKHLAAHYSGAFSATSVALGIHNADQ
ncbi:MAG: oligoribonuclease [Propionibacteriaceae bacterium]|nr:oligoribonuclease [Propionibacteriaceae bacterium]